MSTSRPYTLAVYIDATGEWRWTLWAYSKRIIADSGDGYATKANALRAAKRLQTLITDGADVRLRVDP